ncbi:hypothetical protein; putative exported protein [Herminiimonas arsenicoxydans]|uniref:Lipoprotein n=1 Tax=Herminiimonas arsenicoxydans TaxID=204773 RepID=A4G3M1_HERAR|nr:hypothetical protein; putative exported protein [Herminiimonas arsenicoxydans]
MKNLITLILTAVSVTACAVDDGYYTEQRTYGNSYGGASWYRDEVPYYPNYPNYDRNRNGIRDTREVDRNRNGTPDQREQDRNRNGIPDRKEQERDRDGKSNRTDSNRNWNTGPNRQNQSDDKFRDGDKAPNYKGDRSGNYYGR